MLEKSWEDIFPNRYQLSGVAIGGIIPVIFLIPLELKGVGHALAGSSVGLLFTVGNLGGFISPILGGKIIDLTGSEMGGFLFFAIVIFLMAPLTMLLPETGPVVKKWAVRESAA